MIRFENVSRIYQAGADDVKAVFQVSLHIKKGDFVAIMGPSGSGKSTAMNIMGCLDRPSSGKYFLNDREVGSLGDDTMAEVRNKHIGFVHQNFNLLPRLTALENVELPLVYAGLKKDDRLARARKVVSELGLSDRETHLPVELSGGQQQRVAIARALVNNAALILADEPTGNLDSKTSVEIMSVFERLNLRGTTIVLVTHEPNIAEWAQYTLYFRDGRLAT